MISHVIEFSCQYSDQVKKKHKTWHDGKLKYYEYNNRFMLYPDGSNTLICSTFITNSKVVTSILNSQGFGTSEHKIFGRAVVIITDLIREYRKEIQHQKSDDSLNTKPVHRTIVKEMKKELTNDTFVQEEADVSEQPRKKNQLLIKKSILKNENNPPSLALKFNKPFKAPKRIRTIERTSTLITRPALRNAITKREDHQPDNSSNTTVSNVPNHQLSGQKGDDITLDNIRDYKESVSTTYTNLSVKNTLKNSTHIPQRLTGNLRIKHIDHSPIFF